MNTLNTPVRNDPLQPPSWMDEEERIVWDAETTGENFGRDGLPIEDAERDFASRHIMNSFMANHLLNGYIVNGQRFSTVKLSTRVFERKWNVPILFPGDRR